MHTGQYTAIRWSVSIYLKSLLIRVRKTAYWAKSSIETCLWQYNTSYHIQEFNYMIWDCKIFLLTYSVLFGYCIIQEYHTLSPIVWYYSGERSRDGIQQRPPHVSEQLRLRRDTLRTRLDCGESHLHCNRRIENNSCSNTLCKYVIHVYVLKSIVSEVYRLILFYHLFKKQNHQLIS